MTNARSQLTGEPCSPVSTDPTAVATETAIATQIAVPMETADQDVAGDDSGKKHFKRVTRETIADLCAKFPQPVDCWDGSDLSASPTYRTWAKSPYVGRTKVCRMQPPFELDGDFPTSLSWTLQDINGDENRFQYLNEDLETMLAKSGFQPEPDYEGLKFDITDPRSQVRVRFESKHPQDDRHFRITRPGEGYWEYKWEVKSVKSNVQSLLIKGGPSEADITYSLEAGPGPDIVYSLRD